MALMVFAIALDAEWNDVVSLLRKPRLLAKSLLAMNVVMPVVAVAMVVAFDLDPAVEVALFATALSPVPPIIPGKELKAGGRESYVLGLLVSVALVAIVFVPVVAEAVGHAFGRPTRVTAGQVGTIVATSILLPVVAGLAAGRFAPAFAKRAAKPLTLAASVALGVACIPVLVDVWPAMAALLGRFSLVAMIVFVVVGLVVGHVLGGPVDDNRTVLALSTSARHPAVALAIAHMYPDPKAIAAAVLLLLLVAVVVQVPYVKWRERMHAKDAKDAT